LPKGGITPLWPPAHRASGPEGKEGRGEIFIPIKSGSIMDSLVTSQPNLLPFGVGYGTEFFKVSSMKPPRRDSFSPFGGFLIFHFKNIKMKGEQK